MLPIGVASDPARIGFAKITAARSGGRLPKLSKAYTSEAVCCRSPACVRVLKGKKMILSVLDAVNASTGFVRPVREGEQVLNGGLVVAVGVKEKDGDLLRVQALVLRTSGITSKTPCVIEIWVDLSKPLGSRVTSESSPECDCPAGNSAKCKHITAVLLYLARIEESDLEDLSCTDIEQQWGEMKAASLKEYEGKRLSELCHVKAQRDVYASTMPEVTKEMEERWRQKLTNCAVLSEYSLFTSGLRTGLGNDVSAEDNLSRQEEHLTVVKRLLTFRTWAVLGRLRQLTQQKLLTIPPKLEEFYSSNVVVTLDQSIVIGSAPQGGAAWKKYRGLRQTANKARSQYTYYSNRRANWDKRYNDVFKSKFSGNSYTANGLRCEVLARDLYEEQHKCKVFDSGLLVRPELPWLGASLDGTILDDQGNFVNNLEIKTVKEGKHLTAEELLENKCIKTLDENDNVKKNNDHYCQMQIGMLLSGMEMCHYYVYSDIGNDAVKRAVHFDPNYTLDICSTLIEVHFEEFLPRMMKDSVSDNKV